MTAASTSPPCKDPATTPLVPVIDRTKCEGKEDCVRVCPNNVFEIRKVPDPERSALPLGARIKLWVHGGKQAYAVREDDCGACGACVTACPEHAIKLSASA